MAAKRWFRGSLIQEAERNFMTKVFKELKQDQPSSNPWEKPQKLDALDVAFPTKALSLMPAYEDIPEDFRRERGAARKWTEFQSTWFFCGLKDLQITPKPGIDKADALRHLSSIQGSWDPSHQHKQAGVAYLASLWFEDVKYKAAK
jgi:hypothetical protein